MRNILAKYDVDPDFLNVIFSFGESPNLAEGCSNNLTMQQLPNGEMSKFVMPEVVAAAEIVNRDFVSDPIC